MGAVTVVIGAALGVRYIFAGELAPRSAAAIIALPAGEILIALQVAALVHGLPWRQALATGCMSAAAVSFVGFLVAPGVLATNVPRVPGLPLTPSDRGLAYQDVTMRTSDGLMLAGWYLPSHNGAAVVLRHGSGATKASELDHLAVLADAGFGVLVPDGRGRGQNGGKAMDFGWYGDDDLEPAIDLLATRPDVDAASASSAYRWVACRRSGPRASIPGSAQLWLREPRAGPTPISSG